MAVKLPDGKWFKKTADSLEAAQRLERKVRAEVFEGKFFDVQRSPTLDGIWEKYEPWAKQHKRSWDDDKTRYELHIKPHLGSQEIAKIKPQDVESVLQAMREKTTPRGKPYAPASIKQVLVLLKRLINWAQDRELYQGKSPCARIKAPTFDNQRTTYLSKAQAQRLFEVLDGWKNRPVALAVLFGLATGRRKGEILGLTWDGVDLEAGLITWRPENAKNKRAQTLPVNKKALEILRECWKLRNSEYVFSTSKGKSLTSLDNAWKRIRVKAGLDGFRYHDLRHSFASWLASSGQASLYEIGNLLGHRTVTMTQRYSHLLDESLRRAAATADSIFPE
ncbi:tyrosine-type recombinase/integrase [Desulfocurvibacter africanus]|uniref:tyrosine-type recombinase/integrase n=1 Tax=Desulfocurvibacter africanus TaxID=873 RepID=UPI00137680E5|nr:site-specific integrase [Desulfocurvibacter africanus]